MRAGLIQKLNFNQLSKPVQVRCKISKAMAEDDDLVFYCGIRKGFPTESILSTKPYIQILI